MGASVENSLKEDWMICSHRLLSPGQAFWNRSSAELAGSEPRHSLEAWAAGLMVTGIVTGNAFDELWLTNKVYIDKVEVDR
jgi:hypothetical protein